MRSIGNGDAAVGAGRMDAAARTAGALAHEFANVLGTVRTMASVLKEELAEGSEAAADLEIVLDSLEAGDRLLRELRAFAHPPDLGEGTADLVDVAYAVQAEIGAAPGRDRAVEVQRPTRPLSVRAAPDRLQAQLSRLVLALLEEMPTGGVVRIQALPDPGESVRGWLAVECRGLALDDGVVSRLFEPFAVGKSHHAGLALPGVYAAVTKAGGSVAAETLAGAGLTIRLGLPLAPGHAGEPEGSSR